MARFCPIFSGSSGNCTYIGTAAGGILVDAGMNAKQMTLALKRMDIEPESIKAIFITHEHSDHICGLRVFASKFGIDTYSSKGTLEALDEMNILNDKYKAYEIGEGVDVGGFYVTSFNTSHDSRESVGYKIELAEGRTASVATDLGEMTDDVMNAVQGSDLVLIESNHEVSMLENGHYPYYLKKRILSKKGHLSNEVCAHSIAKLLHKGTTRFFLGHLSRENNDPHIAYQSAFAALTGEGAVPDRDFSLKVATRSCPEKITVF